MRALLVIAIGVVGYATIMPTLAYTLRDSATERAYALAPADGRIVSLLSRELSGAKASEGDRNAADRLARVALLKDATAVAAVTTLGLNAQVRGNGTVARRYLEYADKLSRRDLLTRIWAIEDAVARNDIPDALRQYDIALRTSRRAPDLLYPVLIQAIDDPAIAQELVRTLAAKPPWAPEFVQYLSENSKNPRMTVGFYGKLRRVGVPTSDTIDAVSINQLVAVAAYDTAWAYYASVRAGADRRRSRDPQFTLGTTSPSVFDWVPAAGDTGISTSVQGGTQGGVFDFAAPPGVGGQLLQQLQLLPAGGYVIEGHSTGIEQPMNSRPYWTLLCLDGRELGRVFQPNSTVSKGQFRGQFSVPQGCAVQYLRFMARPSDDMAGSSGQIDRLALRPAD